MSWLAVHWQEVLSSAAVVAAAIYLAARAWRQAAQLPRAGGCGTCPANRLASASAACAAGASSSPATCGSTQAARGGRAPRPAP